MGGTPNPKGKAKAKPKPKVAAKAKVAPMKRPAAAAAVEEDEEVEEVPETAAAAVPKPKTMKRPAASPSAGVGSGSGMKRPSIWKPECAMEIMNGETEEPGAADSAETMPAADDGAGDAGTPAGSETSAPVVPDAPHGDTPPSRRSAMKRPAAASPVATGTGSSTSLYYYCIF